MVAKRFRFIILFGIVILFITTATTTTSTTTTIFQPESTTTPLCVNMCGDGVCAAVVCMGSGCPCAESAGSCPADCGPPPCSCTSGMPMGCDGVCSAGYRVYTRTCTPAGCAFEVYCIFDPSCSPLTTITTIPFLPTTTTSTTTTTTTTVPTYTWTYVQDCSGVCCNEFDNPSDPGTKCCVGEICETDCTYTNDNLIHKECHGINGCNFYDATPEILEKCKNICDLAQPGWIREYNETHEIECAEGYPQPKTEVKATVTCEEGNLIKMIKLITYQGKLARLVVVTCG